MEFKLYTKLLCHRLIKILNTVLTLSGGVTAMTAVTLSLLAISKQLYLVRDQAAWASIMLVVLVLSVANIAIAIIVLFLTRITKFEGLLQTMQKAKGLQLYVKVEAYTVSALMTIGLLSFPFYTQGASFATFPGDPWWVKAISLSTLISWLTGLLRMLQLITWGCDLRIRK